MAKGSKGTFHRIPKIDRKNAKLWADGIRETVLQPHVEPYADAFDRGWKAERDYLRLVCDEYHARIDWRLEDHEEPPLPLREYDPAVESLPEMLSPEELQAKSTRLRQLDERIRRWLKYRVKKLRKLSKPTLDFRKNPYGVMLSKLTNITAPPKARQAYQQFMHECYKSRINPMVQELWREGNKDDPAMAKTQPNAAFRATVARNLFKKLDPKEQIGFAERAKAEATKAREEYEKKMTSPPSLAPEDIQQCIDNIPMCIAPLIQGIQERTKFKFFLLYGGPTPSNEGEITAYHINFGRNLANQPFSSFKQEVHTNFTHARWVEYLGTCFSDEEIKMTALSPGDNSKPTTASDEETEPSSSESSSSESDDDSQPPLKKRKKGGKHASSSTRRPSSGAKVPQPNPSLKKTNQATPATHQSPPTSTSPHHSTTGIPTAPAGAPARLATIPARRPGSLLKAPPSSQFRSVSLTPDLLANPSKTTAISKPSSSFFRAHSVAPSASLAGSSNATAIPNPSNSLLRAQSVAPRTSEASNSILVPNPSTSLFRAQSLAPSASSLHAGSAKLSGDRSSRISPLDSNRRPTVHPTHSESPAELADETIPPHKKRKVTQPSGGARAEAVSNLQNKRSVSHSSNTLQTSQGTTPPSTSLSSPSSTPPVSSPISGSPPRPSAISPLTASSNTATSGTPSPSEDYPTCPTQALDWFKEAYASVTGQDLGEEYLALIKTFTAIEAAYQYSNPSKGLIARGRPDELRRWIAGGRWRVRAPAVNDPGNFGKVWWTWWKVLQPGWRKFSTDNRPVIDTYGEDWKTLLFPGQNGVLSIVATLYWWGCALDGPSGPRQACHTDWLAAVRDVSWMLTGLLSHINSSPA